MIVIIAYILLSNRSGGEEKILFIAQREIPWSALHHDTIMVTTNSSKKTKKVTFWGLNCFSLHNSQPKSRGKRLCKVFVQGNDITKQRTTFKSLDLYSKLKEVSGFERNFVPLITTPTYPSIPVVAITSCFISRVALLHFRNELSDMYCKPA